MDCKQLAELVQAKSIEVCIDSRMVKQGGVFVAIKGSNLDGHRFIAQAVTNGAKFIVCGSDYEQADDSVEYVVVDDSSLAAGILAQASQGYPAQKLIPLAVTGTNGKTTTSMMTRAVINAAGSKCGLIGTIENDTCEPTGSQAAELTTPDAVSLAKLMAKMVSNGAEYMCIEASSHSLEQKRLAGIEFKAAAFTNLTGDHLDYHKTMQAYLDAKASLFEQLCPSSTAILNKDDENSLIIAGRTKANVLWYSVKDSNCDIFADIKSLSSSGSEYDLCIGDEKVRIASDFCGLHNVSNQLAAAGLCFSARLTLEQIAEGLAKFKNVPGRLDRVDCGQRFGVFIDYAHTDDALANVLQTLTPICDGRLITVFGCGGDRDKTKRARMASVAQKYSDVVFVTSDNPRTEEPKAIIDDIMEGFEKSTQASVYVEPDRAAAIRNAVELAQKGDIILIAGKGHENYQIIGTTKYHFDDKEVVRNVLQKV